MAILTPLPGLEVAVDVDGQRAHEYDADPDEVESSAQNFQYFPIGQTHGHGTPYVLKYIEAKPDKPFAFIIDMSNCGPFVKGAETYYTCRMDGFSVGSKRADVGIRAKRSSCRTGSSAAGWKRHHFRFGSLDVGKCTVYLAPKRCSFQVPPLIHHHT